MTSMVGQGVTSCIRGLATTLHIFLFCNIDYVAHSPCRSDGLWLVAFLVAVYYFVLDTETPFLIPSSLPKPG